MLRLHPRPEVNLCCPRCAGELRVEGWYIPGMRTLADLVCAGCRREFYGDLPSGHGLFYPMLLEKSDGAVHDAHGVPYFADWLRTSYGRRRNEPFPVHVESLRPLKRPVILNCLDAIYGHSVQKLLNAQHYLDSAPTHDLFVVVPRPLRWMVPDGAAEIWTVDVPFDRGAEWSDGFADQLALRMSSFEEVWLSRTFPHPHPDDFQIARFTRVEPFVRTEWAARQDAPVVTCVLREDRIWAGNDGASATGGLSQRLAAVAGRAKPSPVRPQIANVNRLAERLRRRFPNGQLAVTGIGRQGDLSAGILDLRSGCPSVQTEREWCEQHARSHVVFGVHGSHMLLPSAHAGATIELVPAGRWGNLLQDLLHRSCDVRTAALLYRTLPLATSLDDICDVMTALIEEVPLQLLGMSREYVTHGSPDIVRIPALDRTVRRKQSPMTRTTH